MKSQINQLKSEAEANYSASRWEDSAKTYEHLVGLAQDNNDLEQAIEFAIAAVRAWKYLLDKEPRINRLYQAIGIISLKKAALGFESVAKKAEEDKDLKETAANYEEAGLGYSLIQSYDKAKSCLESSVKYFEKLSKDAMEKKDYETAIHLFDRISNVYDKISTLFDKILVDKKDIDEAFKQSLLEEKKNVNKSTYLSKKNKAFAHEKLAKYYLEMNDSDCKQIAEKEYVNAIKILESIGESQLAKKLATKKDKIKC
ncbi:MAG: hypothetical protein HZR80_02315 [Candidatus Heimdallarchaeota archaeon]